MRDTPTDIGFYIAGLVSGLLLMGAILTPTLISQMRFNAIKAGVAEYIVNPTNGVTTFIYKTPNANRHN